MKIRQFYRLVDLSLHLKYELRTLCNRELAKEKLSRLFTQLLLQNNT